MIFHGRKSKAIKRQINVLARLSALNEAKAPFEARGSVSCGTQQQQTGPSSLALAGNGL